MALRNSYQGKLRDSVSTKVLVEILLALISKVLEEELGGLLCSLTGSGWKRGQIPPHSSTLFDVLEYL